MLTLSYRSTVVRSHASLDLISMVAQSYARNADRSISGILLFDGDYFLQTLEGPRDAVTTLFLSIHADTRHTDIALFGVRDLQQQRFPDWHMHLLGRDCTVELVPDMAFLDFSDQRLDRLHRDVAGRMGSFGSA